MFRCVAELFGVPREVTELAQVEVELKDDASLEDLIAGLRHKIPALEGEVICAGKNKLTEAYAFNINGQFHFSDTRIQLHDSDHVALLLLATGG